MEVATVGGHVSQQSYPYPVDDISKVAQLALQALASGKRTAAHRKVRHPSDQEATCARAISQRVFESAIASDAAALRRTFDALQGEGHQASELAFEVIPTVARNLGEAWIADEISFVDVTIGSARLQNAVHALMDEPDGLAFLPDNLRKNCLVLLPAGAQHTLGATVLASQLRHAGMRVTRDLQATPQTLRTLPSKQRFDAIFISASLSETSDILGPLIAAARLQWPDSKVILGGTFQENGSDAVAASGADYVTQNWQDALDLCG